MSTHFSVKLLDIECITIFLDCKIVFYDFYCIIYLLPHSIMIVVCILYLLNLIDTLDFAIVAKFLLIRHVIKLYFYYV